MLRREIARQIVIRGMDLLPGAAHQAVEMVPVLRQGLVQSGRAGRSAE